MLTVWPEKMGGVSDTARDTLPGAWGQRDLQPGRRWVRLLWSIALEIYFSKKEAFGSEVLVLWDG